MDCKLLLYVEEDCIIPISVDAGGRTHEYVSCNDNRMWLYFYNDGKTCDFGKKYAENAKSGIDGYYHDIFANMASGKKLNILGVDSDYSELIKASGLSEAIKSFFTDTTGNRMSFIKTIYVFAQPIEWQVRKNFMQAMEHEGFETCSFSAKQALLLSGYAEKKNRSRVPEFGDRMLLVNSVNERLRVSVTIFDGNEWLTDDSFQYIDGVGDMPFRETFVKTVIQEIDANRNFLHNEQLLREEVLYQMANAEKWIESRYDDTYIVSDFSYKIDPDIRYSCNISSKHLETVYNGVIRNALASIITYKNRIVGNVPATLLLIGQAFEDTHLVERLKAELKCQTSLSITPNLLSVAIAPFLSETVETEVLSEFDSIQRECENRNREIGLWIENASKLRTLLGALNVCSQELARRLNAGIADLEAGMEQVVGFLKHSDFDGAKSKYGSLVFPDDNLISSIESCKAQLEIKDNSEGVIGKLANIKGAMQAVSEINGIAENINSAFGLIHERTEKLRELEVIIRFLQESYPEYLELKRAYNRAATFLEKKALIEKMTNLTMEELPQLKLRSVKASLQAEVKVEKAGVFRKKKTLCVSMKVLHEETLPCDTLLNISGEMQIHANVGDRNCVAVTIEKGVSSYSYEMELPDDRLSGDTVYIFLWPGEDVLDRDAIQCDYVRIKFKL